VKKNKGSCIYILQSQNALSILVVRIFFFLFRVLLEGKTFSIIHNRIPRSSWDVLPQYPEMYAGYEMSSTRSMPEF
jgi:hypothetical protein